MCVHRARQSSGCACGPWPQWREAQHGEGSHTQRKDRGRENKSGGAGTARTLPGGSFFLSAIINGILPLTHSSLRQTKDPAFQCSLTGQPASHPATARPNHSPRWTRIPSQRQGAWDATPHLRFLSQNAESCHVFPLLFKTGFMETPNSDEHIWNEVKTLRPMLMKSVCFGIFNTFLWQLFCDGGQI